MLADHVADRHPHRRASAPPTGSNTRLTASSSRPAHDVVLQERHALSSGRTRRAQACRRLGAGVLCVQERSRCPATRTQPWDLSGPTFPGHNSALHHMEAQIDCIVEAVRIIESRDCDSSMSVRSAGPLQRQDPAAPENTTWNSGCASWYLTADGHNATMYPGASPPVHREPSRVDIDDYVTGYRACSREDTLRAGLRPCGRRASRGVAAVGGEGADDRHHAPDGDAAKASARGMQIRD